MRSIALKVPITAACNRPPPLAQAGRSARPARRRVAWGRCPRTAIGELNQDIAMRNIRGRTALGYRVDAVAGLGLVTARTEQ